MASSSVGLTKEEKLRIQTKYKPVTPNEINARIKNGTLVTRELAKVPEMGMELNERERNRTERNGTNEIFRGNGTERNGTGLNEMERNAR